MEIDAITGIFFSPTGTTEKIAAAIAQGMNACTVRLIDCTSRNERNPDGIDLGSGMVILAVPVYYGRVPEEMIPLLNSLKGDGRPVVVVVVYGNREYDDALLELYDIAIARGFVPLAAAAFVAEHSYSTPSRPIAHSRPDSADMQKATAFGAAVAERIGNGDGLTCLEKGKIPGNFPYIEPANLNMIKQARHSIAFTPETDMDLCTQCGICSEACPTNAIDPGDHSTTDRWACLICFACIKKCPEKARQMADAHFDEAVGQLQQRCLKRKEPEIFV